MANFLKGEMHKKHLSQKLLTKLIVLHFHQDFGVVLIFKKHEHSWLLLQKTWYTNTLVHVSLTHNLINTEVLILRQTKN